MSLLSEGFSVALLGSAAAAANTINLPFLSDGSFDGSFEPSELL